MLDHWGSFTSSSRVVSLVREYELVDNVGLVTGRQLPTDGPLLVQLACGHDADYGCAVLYTGVIWPYVVRPVRSEAIGRACEM